MTAASNKPDANADISKAATAAAARSIALTGNRIESSDLFAATREITIAHGAEIYRLRLTSQNKLILTK
jgi:hemin uptake protein HemP